MKESSYRTDDPIVALATPRGRSALALIRASGPRCIETLATVFSRPKALNSSKGHRVHYGWLKDIQGSRIDEILVTVFRSPASYTSQDSVEISCHGGLAVTDKIIRLLCDIGFRSAAPGEFTFRAFSAGKIDLTRAEAVKEIIEARSDRARAMAAYRLAGSVENIIDTAKNVVRHQSAIASLALDYPEDETETVPFDFAAVQKTRESLKKLISTWKTGRLYSEGLQIALVGPSNAGKSSLFNAFLKEERSIVTEIPGTTRDWVEAWLNLDGIPLRLMDTAGLRNTKNPIEEEGIRRTRKILAGSDLIIAVADGTCGEAAAMELYKGELAALEDGRLADADLDCPENRIIRVWNKSDIGAKAPQGWLAVSALKGKGISDLEELIRQGVSGEGFSMEKDAPAINSMRQKKLLESAVSALERFDDTQLTPIDLLAEDLHDALNALGELTGEVTRTDILNTMFGEFCVGK